MAFARCMIIVALAAAPFALAAQERAPLPDPADPASAVPQPAYESAFKEYRRQPEAQDAPATAWQDANSLAGALGGHAGQARRAEASPSTAGDGAQRAAADSRHAAHHASGDKP